MVVGIRDLLKLFSIAVVVCCAVFVCTLFINYNIDIMEIKEEIISPQGRAMYEAQVSMGKVVAAVSGGCLVLTTVVMLIFYVKNYIDSHGKELGILKALGYSNIMAAKHFWVFGLSVLVGCIPGFIGAWLYMPVFYEIQNKEELLPELLPQFHIWLGFDMIVLPVLFFILISVGYAYMKMKNPVLNMLKEMQDVKVKENAGTRDFPFLKELERNTLRNRKILVFFVGFSAFCFSSMTQMSMSMEDLASQEMSLMILFIGMILAFMTLLLSLSSVMKGNAKKIAMMKVFGYTRSECSRSILGAYRPVSYIGFIVGSIYQYMLLKVMVTIVFADLENMPEYHFDFKACLISFVLFLLLYGWILHSYSRKIGKMSVKGIMLE